MKRRMSAARRDTAVNAAIASAFRRLALTSGQIGKIADDLVYRVSTLRSDGELVFYPPKDDNEGIDDIVKRRYRGADIKIQVKARASQRSTGAFELSVDASDLPPADPKQLVVVHFDTERADSDVIAWVIPSADFVRFSSFSAGQYQALLSPAPGARDRWVKYRNEMRDIAEVFNGLLDEVERATRRAKRGGSSPRRKAAKPRNGRGRGK